MANILDLLKQILTARYGKDVRQSIHDAIYQCYQDGKAGAIDVTAREQIDELKETLGSTDISDIGDGTATGAITELNNALVSKEYLQGSAWLCNANDSYLKWNYYTSSSGDVELNKDFAFITFVLEQNAAAIDVIMIPSSLFCGLYRTPSAPFVLYKKDGVEICACYTDSNKIAVYSGDNTIGVIVYGHGIISGW